MNVRVQLHFVSMFPTHLLKAGLHVTFQPKLSKLYPIQSLNEKLKEFGVARCDGPNLQF